MPKSRTNRSDSSSRSGSSRSGSSKHHKKLLCQYDPFCFRENRDHIKKYYHTLSGYNRIILDNIGREQLIRLISVERINDRTFTLAAVLKLTDKYLMDVKNKRKSDIRALYSLHVRLQEEAIPNQSQLSAIFALI